MFLLGTLLETKLEIEMESSWGKEMDIEWEK